MTSSLRTATRGWGRGIVLQVAALLALATLAAPARAALNEYPLPDTASAPAGIVSGPAGNLWFTEADGLCVDQTNVCGAIGEMTTAGSLVAEYPLPNQNSDPAGITVGPDGALWFAESGNNAIGRLDPSAALNGTSDGITEYSVINTPGSQPTGITVGPDGNLWFTERGFNDGNRIGRITPAGVITEYCIRSDGKTAPPGCMTPALSAYPYQGLQPTGIVAGPDGRLWFTETNPYCSDPSLTDSQGNPAPTRCDPYDDGSGNDDGIGAIGAITTSGQVSEYPLPTPAGQEPNSQPLGIAAGPDGALWFTENNNSAVGRITTGGTITEYEIPGTDTQPTGITTGPDGKLWFALAGAPSNGGNRLAEADPGTVSPGTSNGIGLFPQLSTVQSCPSCPQESSRPDSLATGPDAKMWFTEMAGARIGALSSDTGTTAQTPPPPPPPPAPPPPQIIQLPGPPAFPVFGKVFLTDRFFPVARPSTKPTTQLLRLCRRKLKRSRRAANGKRRRAAECRRLDRIAVHRGTVFVFNINAPATVTVSFYRSHSGLTVGRLTMQARPGRNSLAFSGWLRRRPLSPGHWEAELVAQNQIASDPPSTQTSRPATVFFTVLGRRRSHLRRHRR